MAEATRTEVFDGVTAEQFIAAVLDFDAYPDLVPAMNAVEVLEHSGERFRVRYEMKIIKTFNYVLDVVREGTHKVTWDLVDSGLIKSMKGYWLFDSESDGRLKVTYHTEVGLPKLAPKAVVDKLVGSTLPAMMKTYYEHAKKMVN